MNKWNKAYWQDLAERVGSTALYAVIAVLTGTNTDVLPSDPKVWWTLVGLPTVLALLKGLVANMANPDTGPSLLKG